VHATRWLAAVLLPLSFWAAGFSHAGAAADASRDDRDFVFGLNPIHMLDGPFGYKLDPEPFRSIFRRQVRLGAEATRLWTFWGHIEPQPRNYRWGQLDRAVRRSVALGLEPWLLVVGSPAWACAVPPVEPHPANVCSPSDLRPYKRWLQKLARRYGGDVRYFEIWNEPNLSYYWPPQNDPGAYARLLKASYDAINEVSREAQVVLAGPSSGDFTYLDSVLAALDGQRPFDAVSMHAYRITEFPSLVSPWQTRDILLPDGDIVAATLKREILIHKRIFADHGYEPIDLWITEIGWPAFDASSASSLFSLKEQARFLRQTYELVLNDPEVGFVRGVFWFSDRDWASSPYEPNAVGEFGGYGVVHFNRMWKPAAYEYERLASSAE
jgi:hypothetical protein